MANDSARISPTAHYTGEVWCRHQLSPAAFGTRFGGALFVATAPLVGALARVTGGLTLERMLLERHLLLDDLLATAIEQDGVTQVIELAAGMSGRALRMLKRFGDRGLSYIETDLPGMVARKRRAIATLDRPMPPGHRICTLDVFAHDTPDSFESVVAAYLNTDEPTAIVSEGLVNYFPTAAVEALWQRVAGVLARFGSGHYLSDLHLRDETQAYWPTKLAQRVIEVVARGKVHLHFQDHRDASQALLRAGFSDSMLYRPQEHLERLGLDTRRGPGLVRIVHARVGASSLP